MSLDELSRAAVFAGQAPSLHNTQPWRWGVRGDVMELRVEPRRVLWSTDPLGRLAVVSCGIALHHAVALLAAEGWACAVGRLPDPGDRELLASVRLVGPCPADHDAVRLVEAVARRRTDRRGTPSATVDLDRVRVVREAVRAHGADLTPLRPRQVLELAAAAELAHEARAGDPGWRAEIDEWVGGERTRGAGIPRSALPVDDLPLTAPARALRRSGATLVAESRRRAAVFAVLHTPGDTRADWLAAGEGLSAGWLTATGLDLAVLPLSVVAEVAGGRDQLRRMVNGAGHPYLVLRLAAGIAATTPTTPRLPVEAILTRVHGPRAVPS